MSLIIELLIKVKDAYREFLRLWSRVRPSLAMTVRGVVHSSTSKTHFLLVVLTLFFLGTISHLFVRFHQLMPPMLCKFLLIDEI